MAWRGILFSAAELGTARGESCRCAASAGLVLHIKTDASRGVKHPGTGRLTRHAYSGLINKLPGLAGLEKYAFTSGARMKKLSPGIVILLLAVALSALLDCSSDSSTATGPTGSISGTITFRNPWPGSGDIYVAVFAQYPPTGAPDAFTNPIKQTDLGPGRTYKYTLPGIQTGTYRAVLVGWRGGVGQDKCTGLFWAFPDSVGVNAGCVAQDPGPLAVSVKKNTTTPNVNMVSDLSLAGP
jgi:hypothetical protein